MNHFENIRRRARAGAFLFVLLAAPGHAQFSANGELDAPTKAGATDEAESIRPFRVQIPEATLVNLRQRLAATRLPDPETDQSQGVQLATMKELVRYWQTEYDWRKAEARLNALPQFVTTIDGEEIHFIHVRSKHPNALPLIMTHGWPGSIFELLNVDRSADQSDGSRRAGGGRVRYRHPLDARLRVFRQADYDRMESSPHRARLGHLDEAPGLHPLRGAGRRLGRESLRGAGAPSAEGLAGDSHQPALKHPAGNRAVDRRGRPGAGWAVREGGPPTTNGKPSLLVT